MTQLAYSLTHTPELLGVHLSGCLDFGAHKIFQSLITELGSASPSQKVVIDLNELDSIDPAGLGLLLIAKDAAARYFADSAVLAGSTTLLC